MTVSASLNVALLAMTAGPQREALARELREEGWRVLEASGGEAVADLMATVPVSMVLVREGLDDFDVATFCMELRQVDQCTPLVMFLQTTDPVRLAAAYQMGFDDVIAPEVPLEEALLRIRSLNRRYRLGQDVLRQLERNDRKAVLELGAKTVDLERGVITGAPGQEAVKLTPVECHILDVLSRQPGRSMGQREIIERIWGAEYLDSSISVPAYIRRLREKIEADPGDPRYIKTVWGFGYQLALGE